MLPRLIKENRVTTEWKSRIMSFRFPEKNIAVRIFLICWLVFSLHFATNTVRELYPALSLGDRLSFDVSEYAGLHHDIFEMPGRGSFINNNPGASIIGAVPYAFFSPVTNRIIEYVQKSRAENPPSETGGYDTIYPLAQEFYEESKAKGFDIKFGLAAGVIQAFAMAPISALGVVVMFWILLSVTKNTRISILLAFLYAFATPIFYRTGQLNQNVLLANFALFAFALLWRPWSENEGKNKPLYFAAGLCCGWTVVLDYSGIIAVAALGGYAVARWVSTPKPERNPSDLFKFALGVALCGAVLMAYQWSSFGNPILPAQSYMPPANFTDLGYRGFTFPQMDLLFETAFGIRYGLFTSAPILLLALFVPVWLKKSTRLLEHREMIFVVSFAVLFFIFCSANQYGRMQFNTGVRHIVPIVPFIFLLAANVLITMPKSVAITIGVLTTYWSWCLVMYRDVEQGSCIFESIKHITLEGVRLPWLTTLERMGFVGHGYALPLVLLSLVGVLLIWSVGSGGRRGELET